MLRFFNNLRSLGFGISDYLVGFGFRISEDLIFLRLLVLVKIVFA